MKQITIVTFVGLPVEIHDQIVYICGRCGYNRPSFRENGSFESGEYAIYCGDEEVVDSLDNHLFFMISEWERKSC